MGGCGYTCAAKGVDHECRVVVLNTGRVIDAEVCMSRRKIVKSVIAVEKDMYFIMKTMIQEKKSSYLNEH